MTCFRTPLSRGLSDGVFERAVSTLDAALLTQDRTLGRSTGAGRSLLGGWQGDQAAAAIRPCGLRTRARPQSSLRARKARLPQDCSHGSSRLIIMRCHQGASLREGGGKPRPGEARAEGPKLLKVRRSTSWFASLVQPIFTMLHSIDHLIRLWLQSRLSKNGGAGNTSAGRLTEVRCNPKTPGVLHIERFL